MNRRDAMVSLFAFGAAPFAAEAQQATKRWRIGVLRPAPDDSIFRRNFEPFQQTLRDLGFIEGSNLSTEFRVRPGKPDEVFTFANDLLRAKPDAILAVAPAGVAAAAKATTSVPIVAVDLASDPVALGYAKSLGRPGGNITGLFLDLPEMSGKWIQLLKSAVPNLTRAAVLWDPATGPYLLKGVEAAAASMGIKILRLEAQSTGDFARAFESATSQKMQALMTGNSPVFNSARKELAELALKHRLPAIMPFPDFAVDGGLMGYAPQLSGMFRRAGAIMAKILQGARPGEIAIERPTHFELVINVKTAKTLKIAIPQSLLLRADRVIE